MSFSYNKRTNVASGVGDIRVSRILATTVDEKPIFLSIDALRGLVPDVDSRISGYIHNDDVDSTTRLLVGVSPSYRAISDYVDSQRDAVIGESGDQWTNDKTLYGLLQKMGVDISAAKSQITGDPADTAKDRTLWGLYNAIQNEGIDISNIIGDPTKVAPVLQTLHSNSRQLLSNSFMVSPTEAFYGESDTPLQSITLQNLTEIVTKMRSVRGDSFPANLIRWKFKLSKDINNKVVDIDIKALATNGYGFRIIITGTTADGYSYQLIFLTTGEANYDGTDFYIYNNGTASLDILGFEVVDTYQLSVNINNEITRAQNAEAGLLGPRGASSSSVSIRGAIAKINEEAVLRQQNDLILLGNQSSQSSELSIRGTRAYVNQQLLIMHDFIYYKIPVNTTSHKVLVVNAVDRRSPGTPPVYPMSKDNWSKFVAGDMRGAFGPNANYPSINDLADSTKWLCFTTPYESLPGTSNRSVPTNVSTNDNVMLIFQFAESSGDTAYLTDEVGIIFAKILAINQSAIQYFVISSIISDQMPTYNFSI